MIHRVLHRLKVLFILFLKRVLIIVPKNKKLLLFTAWFGKKYADNCMYVFEFFLKNHKEYTCFWYATDRNLFNELKGKGIPVVYSKTLKAKWIQLRAKVLLSSVQLSEYNPYLLTNCIYIDLGHGHSIKNPGDVINNKESSLFYVTLKKKIEYYTIVCADHLPYHQADVLKSLGENRVVVLGFARNDVFYDSCLLKNKNASIRALIDGKRVISYLPTHRADGEVPLHISELLDLKKIESICSQNNAIFLIKKHFYHRNEVEHLEEYPHIVDITNDPSIDTQVLLYDTDILISDYSACFIDYLLLNRPIVLYQYDFEHYMQKERDLLIPFHEIGISSYPATPAELCEDIELIISNNYDDKRSVERQKIRDEYFSRNISSHVREDVSNFIISLTSTNGQQ